MANEIKDALDRAAAHVQKIYVSQGSESPVKHTLLALIDAIAEIAATLPAPHTVPKE